MRLKWLPTRNNNASKALPTTTLNSAGTVPSIPVVILMFVCCVNIVAGNNVSTRLSRSTSPSSSLSSSSSPSSSSSSSPSSPSTLSSSSSSLYDDVTTANTPISYYMKPSQYFSRYFLCRYGMKIATDNREGPDIASGVDLFGNKRRSITQCPSDCDGILQWPETDSGTTRHIPCLQLLTSEFNSDAMHSIQNNVNGDDELVQAERQLELDQQFQLNSFMLPMERLVGANVTRRCSDSEWEEIADYGACGLDSRRLRPLSAFQLEKIYDIREKMITSKFTRVLGSERAFVRCVDDVLSAPPSRLPGPFCGRTFDGWSCFNDTPANSVVWFQCPDFIYGFNPQNKAHKACTADGQWAVHRQTLVSWTNYTSCVDIPDFHFRNMIIKLHIIGYSISLAALLISLSIFFAFKVLSSQTRIRIHKNFFVSFIINNFMWIIWYFAITDQNILSDNGVYCQALHVLLHYFLVCNYFWMFCEGLYLHTILVVAFVSEERILKWFYLIGWGLPVLFAAAYAFFRGRSSDTLNCWIDESRFTWILNVPVLLSFLLNIFFLINIVRVLVTKLQAVNTADAHQTRKAVRATLILIPLLGLHFILTPFRPESNSHAAQAYEVFSAIVSSLQGFCVAMLFCFFNGEVLAQLKKRWNQYLLVHGIGNSTNANSRRMSAYAGTQVSIRLANNSHEISKNNESRRTMVDCETVRLRPKDDEREVDKLTYDHLLDAHKN